MDRRLLSLRRRVPDEQRTAYREVWAELAARATASGAHAWRFISRDDVLLQLEFLEFAAAMDPRADPGVLRLLARLENEIGPAVVEEWLGEE